MFQLITEEKYDAESSEHKGVAIYFATDERLFCENVPKEVQHIFLDYLKEHVDSLQENTCYYILDMQTLYSIVFTIINTPFMVFMATLSPDPQN